MPTLAEVSLPQSMAGAFDREMLGESLGSSLPPGHDPGYVLMFTTLFCAFLK